MTIQQFPERTSKDMIAYVMLICYMPEEIPTRLPALTIHSNWP